MGANRLVNCTYTIVESKDGGKQVIIFGGSAIFLEKLLLNCFIPKSPFIAEALKLILIYVASLMYFVL